MTDVEFARFAGLSAWLAAAMTVVGAVTLMVFFSRGGRWGLALLVSSLVFQVWIGTLLLGGSLVIPAGNA